MSAVTTPARQASGGVNVKVINRHAACALHRAGSKTSCRQICYAFKHNIPVMVSKTQHNAITPRKFPAIRKASDFAGQVAFQFFRYIFHG